MTQQSIFDVIAGDTQPIREWLYCMHRLVPKVYPYDADLSRAFERSLRGLDWWTLFHECASAGDHAAPEADAPAVTFLAWYFARRPDEKAELRRLIPRIDQLLG